MTIYTKSNFIKATIMLAFNCIVLSFFTFVLVKVNKTKEVSDRCTINLMIVCLMLAAMCKFISSSY